MAPGNIPAWYAPSAAGTRRKAAPRFSAEFCICSKRTLRWGGVGEMRAQSSVGIMPSLRSMTAFVPAQPMRIHLARRGCMPWIFVVPLHEPIDNISHLSMAATPIVLGSLDPELLGSNRAVSRQIRSSSKAHTGSGSPGHWSARQFFLLN